MIPLGVWQEECDGQSERSMFARAPGGEWVVREDLPHETYKALSDRQDRWRANGCIDIILDAFKDDRRPWLPYV